MKTLLKTALVMVALTCALALPATAKQKNLSRGQRQSLALCQSMVKDYRALLKKGESQQGNALQLLQNMMLTLQQAKPSRLKIAGELAELKSFSQPDLPTAAAYVAERFQPDAALVEALGPATEDAMGDAAWVTRMPESNLYGVSLMAGTMRCETLQTLFTVSGQKARLVEGSELREGTCGAGRFGAYRKQPILIEGGYDGPITAQSYHLVEGYAIRPWSSGFGPACAISLRYAPDLSLKDSPSCPVADTNCPRLRNAALTMITRYKQNPAALMKRLDAEMGKEGRKRFLALKQAFDAEARARPDPKGRWRLDQSPTLPVDEKLGDIPLVTAPLALPLQDGNDILLVVFGHQLTTGSRDIPVYDVSVRQMKNAVTVPLADFTIALRFGALLESRVKLE